MRSEVENLLLAQIAHFDRIMQVKSRHYAGTSMSSDTEERLESAE
jgi:hypothetical protein